MTKDMEDEINSILKKYEKEYQELAEISEELYDKKIILEEEEKILKGKYKALDDKTGLNKLFEKITKEKEKN